MAVTFAVIVACLLIVEIVELVQSARTRTAVKNIEQNALVSVELVHRIGDDIHSERLLLDRHVFEHDLASMNLIERTIEAHRRDYEDAARAYEALPASPTEAISWWMLTADVAEARRIIDPALALSRQNRTEEAQRTLQRLDPLYERIAQGERKLDRLNQSQVNTSIQDVRQLQLTSLAIRLLLLATVLVTVLLIGRWSTRTALALQQELANANQSLADRNRDLDAFAGRLAHDLRGSLNTISLSNGLIAERFPDAAPSTAVVQRSITQMTNLMDELLTLSRLGETPFAIAKTESVVAALGQRLGPVFTGAGGTLRIDLEPAVLACSEGLLVQLLWNLGENAIKYRRPDLASAVSIEGHVDGGRYTIRVADNGVGMSEQDVRRAFEPFYRAERTRKVSGTGLGLAIVHRIIEASQGTIAIESKVGEGTTFVVSLPLASTPRALGSDEAAPAAPTHRHRHVLAR